jgi:tRNA threonylcarbamoyladenosine modification (KEOPS) complex  Pcc1 subunit
MSIDLKLKVFFRSKENAVIFLKSIKPDLQEKFERSKTSVFRKNNLLNFSIIATDKTAARASFNAIIKPLKLFMILEAKK